MGEITQLLNEMDPSDSRIGEQLMELVYQELRDLAGQKMRHEKPGLTLDATGLVHEAFLRLFHSPTEPHWKNRRHFFVVAAEVMRRVLIDNSRRKKRLKRGGDNQRADLEMSHIALPEMPEDIEAIHEALDKFSQSEPTIAELVKLRYFAGLTIPETAELLDISPRTADSWWAYARAWFQVELQNISE